MHLGVGSRQVEVMQHTATQNHIYRIFGEAGILTITFDENATLRQALVCSRLSCVLDRDIAHIDPNREGGSHPSRTKCFFAVTTSIVKDNLAGRMPGEPIVPVVRRKLSRRIPLEIGACLPIS